MMSAARLTASIAVVAALLTGPAARAGDGPGELRAFVGKYPFDRVKGHSLLQVPELRTRLETLLGKKGAGDLRRLDTVSPIEEQSGWLIASGCRPHNCASEQWTVAVNLADYSVLACLGIEGQPIKFAATGRKLVEQPRTDAHPCPWGEGALAALQKVFLAPL
jgi:hypothetical protein